MLPLVAVAQKGRHFEFDYFVLELGFGNSFNGAPSARCDYKYYNSPDGPVHLEQVEALGYTPGFNIALQFHHDFSNDMMGVVTGVALHSWGNTYKYQTDNKSVKLTECDRVMAVGIPLYIKLGDEIYNRQSYFYFGTQFDFNLSLTTSQKVGSKKLRTKDYNDALNKMTIPIIIGANFTILNFRVGVTPMSIFKKNNEITVGGVQTVKPYKDMNNMTFFANFAFTIPLSQWTVKRSYFLSRIF